MGPTRITVPTELFTPAQQAHYEGDISVPVMKTGPDRYTFDEPLSWQVDFTNTGDALLVSGMVEGRAKTSCARCLDEFSFSVVGEIEGYYVFDPEAANTSDDDEADEFDVLPEDDVIDIEPLIKAALLLEFPLVPLCDEDCKGLCATCGANLNEGPCGCGETVSDRDENEGASSNPFSVLKDIPLE